MKLLSQKVQTDNGKGLVFVLSHQSTHFPHADEYAFSVPFLHAAEVILKDSPEIPCSCILVLKLCKRPGISCFALSVGVSPLLDL